MTFLEFNRKFPNDDAVIDYYIQLRYKGKPSCKHCQSSKVYQKKDRKRIFHCDNCKNCFSVFSNTVFENTHANLQKWFYAVHLFINGKKGIAALQLQREIGGSYSTSLTMLRRIRIAMGNTDMGGFFETIVEMDETYVGGKPRKQNRKNDEAKSKRGRGTNKTPIIGVMDRDNKKVHAKVALPNKAGKKLSGMQLLDVLQEVAKKGITVMTDEFKGYNLLLRKGYAHYRVDHTKEYCVDGYIHTNTIESFWATFKRGFYGIYHSMSVKYLQHYIDEFCFRYNNRNNPHIFDLLLLNTVTFK
ncbi:MAG TPA: IS1595 family transposase [Chitinophagaceae bacterium]|jgi:transposase-like protein|nr:IS1595 family transposase [Chitinophagaceae bacterium]